jgi:hypothetical protein
MTTSALACALTADEARFHSVAILETDRDEGWIVGSGLGLYGSATLGTVNKTIASALEITPRRKAIARLPP